jgi:hypothetical protein
VARGGPAFPLVRRRWGCTLKDEDSKKGRGYVDCRLEYLRTISVRFVVPSLTFQQHNSRRFATRLSKSKLNFIACSWFCMTKREGRYTSGRLVAFYLLGPGSIVCLRFHLVIYISAPWGGRNTSTQFILGNTK